MDFLSSINWLAVIACVIVSMLSGSLWYNPKTFFPVWWKGIGKTEKDTPGGSGSMALVWGLTVISSCVQVVFMALVLNAWAKFTGDINVVIGALIGLFLWVGFIAPTYMVNKLFAGHGLKIWAIEAGNHLLNFILFGVIMGAWR